MALPGGPVAWQASPQPPLRGAGAGRQALGTAGSAMGPAAATALAGPGLPARSLRYAGLGVAARPPSCRPTATGVPGGRRGPRPELLGCRARGHRHVGQAASPQPPLRGAVGRGCGPPGASRRVPEQYQLATRRCRRAAVLQGRRLGTRVPERAGWCCPARGAGHRQRPRRCLWAAQARHEAGWVEGGADA